MGSAIWSTKADSMLRVPALFFIRFFNNHGLLQIKNRSGWWVIKGGSKEYIKKMIVDFKSKIRLNTGIDLITRDQDKIIIKTEDEFEMIFNDDELVKVSAENEIKVKDDELMEALLVKTVKKRVVPQTSKKQKSIPPMEVDLHIHHLTDRAKQMSNFEMLNLQLDTARSQLEFAIKKSTK